MSMMDRFDNTTRFNYSEADEDGNANKVIITDSVGAVTTVVRTTDCVMITLPDNQTIQIALGTFEVVQEGGDHPEIVTKVTGIQDQIGRGSAFTYVDNWYYGMWFQGAGIGC